MMTKMDIGLFMEMLSVDSTSGREREFALFLAGRLKTPHNRVETFEVGDGTLNLLFSWGEPQVFLCTHMDTVPPYIAPVIDGDIVKGRGSCDAKGQILSMFEACRELERQGLEGFGLLLLAGEETGSHGAKRCTADGIGGRLVVVGEPTDGKMVSASKGTKSYTVQLRGKACHSGYPEQGVSAVERFVDFVNMLRNMDFPEDKELGKTTWNIGRLVSDNPQNILSPELSFRIYFRTTFASDKMVQELMKSLNDDSTVITSHGGDVPMRYTTFPGEDTVTVSFGSDAPHLSNFGKRALAGPGSILVAHTPDEYVRIGDMEKAAEMYVRIVKTEIAK